MESYSLTTPVLSCVAPRRSKLFPARRPPGRQGTAVVLVMAISLLETQVQRSIAK